MLLKHLVGRCLLLKDRVKFSFVLMLELFDHLCCLLDSFLLLNPFLIEFLFLLVQKFLDLLLVLLNLLLFNLLLEFFSTLIFLFLFFLLSLLILLLNLFVVGEF